VGAFLVVVVPLLIIKYGFKQPLKSYGLGLPPKGRRALAVWTFLTLTLLSLPAFWMGAHDPGMRQVYPLYRPFTGPGEFILYELSYFPFFLAIEFIFRGYLLFGLAGVRDEEVKQAGTGVKGVFYFHRYALLIQMLSYTAWHLGKPLPELWGTLVWGLAAGATAYAVRSVWPVVFSHWLLNVFLDAVIARPF
jgi:CAAX protease family protein